MSRRRIYEQELTNLGEPRMRSQNGEIDDKDLEGEVILGSRERPIYRKKNDNVVHMINGGVASYPWLNYYIEGVRFRVTSWSILAMIGLTIIFVFMLVGLTPPLPSNILTRYGALEYLVWFPLYAINCVVAGVSDRTEFYAMALFLNFLAFLTYLLLGFIFFYHFVACIIGEIPNTCKNDYWMDTIFFFPAILVFLGSFFCCWQYIIVVKQTSGASEPIVYKVSNR